jgi:hypothetical protein
MAEGVQTTTGNLLQAAELAATLVLKSAPNGLRYTSFGDTRLSDAELERTVQAVPTLVAAALHARAFYFVPLALPESGDAETPSERTVISPSYTPELSEDAICHRNVPVSATPETPAHEAVFISARLLRDAFALNFELFINIGHAFAAEAGIPESFSTLAWSQALADVRGETSQDAWESRQQAMQGSPQLITPDREAPKPRHDEKAKSEFFESAFADALAIYLLSLAVDFDYSELREREYPLLAPNALADRLRLIAQLFPPNPTYEFSIRYRRRA